MRSLTFVLAGVTVACATAGNPPANLSTVEGLRIVVTVVPMSVDPQVVYGNWEGSRIEHRLGEVRSSRAVTFALPWEDQGQLRIGLRNTGDAMGTYCTGEACRARPSAHNRPIEWSRLIPVTPMDSLVLDQQTMFLSVTGRVTN